jgi:hypothetical protein
MNALELISTFAKQAWNNRDMAYELVRIGETLLGARNPAAEAHVIRRSVEAKARADRAWTEALRNRNAP